MIARRSLFAALAAGATLAMPLSSSANDSSAAFGLGGLELRQSDAISLDSEELYISAERITVKYRFTNTSDRDVETLVAFPLPPLPTDNDFYGGDQGYPDWDELDFKTKVDGVEVPLTRVDSVTLNGQPVEARLKQLGWPLRWFDYNDETQKFNDDILVDMPKADQDKYVAEGLLKRDADNPNYVYPAWKTATNITRMQVFPAGKTITVEHSYKPVTGGSVAGSLEKEYRKDSLDWHRTSFCVDEPFLKTFDAIYDKKRPAGERYAPYYESWISYVLKPGANWKGPIKDFRLVVDKGKADNLVSFCGSGVRKISPTQFEMRKSNFEPTEDLQIMIVNWVNPDDFD